MGRVLMCRPSSPISTSRLFDLFWKEDKDLYPIGLLYKSKYLQKQRLHFLFKRKTQPKVLLLKTQFLLLFAGFHQA